MDSLETEIQRAAELLPPNWKLRIDIENGCGDVVALRPDGTEVQLDDGDTCLAEQVRLGLDLAATETEVDKHNA